MAAYTLGTISKLLSVEGGKPEKVDPKLAALFGNAPASSGSASTVYKTVKVSETQLLKNKNKSKPVVGFAIGKGKKKKDDVKLKHKDAAAIRVDAKQKVKNAVKEAAKNDNSVKSKVVQKPIPKLKLNAKKQERDKPAPPPKKKVQDDTITSSTTAAQPNVVAKKRKPKANSKELKEIRKLKRAKARQEKEEQEKATNVKVEEDDGEEVEGVEENGEESTPTQKPTATTKDGEKTLAEKNAPKAKDPELEKRTVFIGNLPPEIKKKALEKMFKKFGNVETVRYRCGAPNKPTLLKKVAINRRELHPDHDTLAAFVRFSTREEAEKAVEESIGLILNDNHLNVDLVVPSEKRDNKKAIFVGNLSLKLTDEELWRFFEDCGKIVNVRVVRDRATGMGKGFGYVNFCDKESVAAALKKNQEELKNRKVRISKCVKKPKVKKEKKPNGKKPNSREITRTDKAGKPKSDSWKPKETFGAGKQHSFQKKRRMSDVHEYGGDRLAEIGKLKRKSKKPNRGELHKANIAKLLTNTKPPVNIRSGTSKPGRLGVSGGSVTNKKKYFK
ncbi:unnamed protein product [Orchesella dallaii]|uniref:RRM domain-containing protein n=1 Tax=Orchesella dallaii TaxID=48710 RepID=A0ABP1QAA1_9HEXA